MVVIRINSRGDDARYMAKQMRYRKRYTVSTQSTLNIIILILIATFIVALARAIYYHA